MLTVLGLTENVVVLIGKVESPVESPKLVYDVYTTV